MATVPRQRRTREIDYPTGDGKPMAETELHLNDQIDLIQTLKDYFEREPMVYVGGNMLVFYEEGNRRKHLAPDVFVVRGVEKKKNVRENYLIWKEGKSPELVIEVTSKSTKNEDKKTQVGTLPGCSRSDRVHPFRPDRGLLEAVASRVPVGRRRVPSDRAGRRSFAQSGTGSTPGAGWERTSLVRSRDGMLG